MYCLYDVRADKTHMRRDVTCWRSLLAALSVTIVFSPGASTEPPHAGFGVQRTDIGVGCTTPVGAITSWRQNTSFLIDHSGAQFLVVRLAELQLPPGARLVIRDGRADAETTSSSSIVFEGDRNSDSVVYSRPLNTDHAVVEYTVPSTVARDVRACYGFYIDEYRFAASGAVRTGQPPKKKPRQPSGIDEQKGSTTDKQVLPSSAFNGSSEGDSIPADSRSENPSSCTDGTESSLRAACVQYDTAVFSTSRAVVRLLIQKESGSIFCTGWLFGCEGHILTNHHCVGLESEANATSIEFLAQGRDCNQSCEEPMSCPGVVEATSSEIIASSPIEALDFTLLLPRLPVLERRQLTATYGFLSMRSQAPDLTERIFIPQHPVGYGKRVALKHGASYGHVAALNSAGCNARPEDLGYYLDTKGGSSGSPVIAYSDKAVVGLHYCGGCLNSAIRASHILEALVNASALPECGRV